MTPSRLYVRCVRWGLTAGAATGAVVGALVGAWAGTLSERVGRGLWGGGLGALVGLVVALVPTFVGAGALSAFLRLHHRQPADPDHLQRDLTFFLAVVVGLVEAAAFALLLAVDGWAAVVETLPVVVVGTVALILVLARARRSIARGWLDEAQAGASPVLSGRPNGSW